MAHIRLNRYPDATRARRDDGRVSRRVRLLTLVVLLWQIAAPAYGQIKAGDAVIVIHRTRIKNGNKVLEIVYPGQDMRVQEVKGDLLWVSLHGTGWINKHHVATPSHAIDFFTRQIKQNRQVPL